MSTQLSSRASSIEDQLWPIACATAVLVGVLTVVVYVNGDFDDERLLFNGYTQLAAVAVFGAAVVYLGSRIKGRVRRTAELAVLLSLALHAVGGLSAVYLFDSKLAMPGVKDPRIEASMENAEDSQPQADYHWGRNDDEEAAQQAFEKPVETDVRDQVVAAAAVKPRNMERPVPAAEVPRAAKPDVSPPDAAAATLPKKPDPSLRVGAPVRRPDASKVEDLPPPGALAMAPPADRETMIPDAPAPAPIAMPEAPKEPSKSLEPQMVQPVKADKYLWAKVAVKSVDPNNAPVPPPRKMTRDDAPASDDLPARQIVAQLPSQAPRRTSTANSGADTADDISRRGSSLARDDRGATMPSSIVPNASLTAELPAAQGGLPGSRLDNQSNVPVDGTDSAHPPLGPNIASAGKEEFARGSSLLPTRRGAIDGRGRAEPSIQDNANSDLDELRPGAPGSNRSFGLVQPAAPARRAIASQTDNGGPDPAAGPSGTLPRTAAEMGILQPSATVIAGDSGLAGAGGAAARPGGQTSRLEVGQNISVRRVAGSGAPGNRAGSAASSNSGADDVPLNALASAGSALPGMGAPRPRRIEQGTNEGDITGDGSIPRRRNPQAGARVFDPRRDRTRRARIRHGRCRARAGPRTRADRSCRAGRRAARLRRRHGPPLRSRPDDRRSSRRRGRIG